MSDETLAAALAPLRERYLVGARARLTVIEAAAEALAAGALDPALRSAAILEAHRLAGSLGTYGLWRGSAYAQDLETLLAEGADAARIGQRVADLRGEFPPA